MKDLYTGYGFLRVGCAVPDTVPGDCDANVRNILAMTKKAQRDGAQLLVFPEMSVTGYTCGDLFYQDVLLDAALEGLRVLSASLPMSHPLLFVGMPLRKDDKLYNIAAVLSGNRVIGFVPKSYIPNHMEFYEKRWFSSGRNRSGTVRFEYEDVPFGDDLLFALPGGCLIGVELCEDLWMPVPPSSYQAMAGARILVNLSASNAVAGKHKYRRELVRQQSARCLAAYIYTSAAGGESTTDTVYSGAVVIAENGRELACSEAVEEGGRYRLADVDTWWLRHDRLKSSAFTENDLSRGKPCRIVTAQIAEHKAKTLLRPIPPEPFVPSDPEEMNERCREILAIQTLGLAKRIRYTGANRVAINVSGGLDSTLAWLVCARTLDLLDMPREKLLTLSLPGYGTTGRTMDNAALLGRSLGCDFRVIGIREACDLHLKDIGHDGATLDTTYENTQARERTQILFDIANREGAIAVGTGDLSEMALGWSTYGGDHLSMYNVNCGVPKTLVRHLIRWMADTPEMISARDVLLDILDTPVSPELLPPDATGCITQKTEEVIGPYVLHDFFLYHFIRYAAAPDKICLLAEQAFRGCYGTEEIRKWLDVFFRRFFAAQFKRSCVPDGPKIGSISLSPRTDWRMPSDISPTAWLQVMPARKKMGKKADMTASSEAASAEPEEPRKDR